MIVLLAAKSVAIAGGTGLQGLVGVWDGDRIELGDESLEVIGLVGHTPGSITLVYAGEAGTHLFTGDSLFPGGPGKTTSVADFTSLMDPLRFVGRAPDQVEAFVEQEVEPIRRRYPGLCGQRRDVSV